MHSQVKRLRLLWADGLAEPRKDRERPPCHDGPGRDLAEDGVREVKVVPHVGREH